MRTTKAAFGFAIRSGLIKAASLRLDANADDEGAEQESLLPLSDTMPNFVKEASGYRGRRKLR